ncbi:hypothetical protein [Vibrio diabolicus]|uniref:hypothetical protein n=1 Tax=Vibrio diabolicus TaxID=50719 RepID=UPI0037511247
MLLVDVNLDPVGDNVTSDELCSNFGVENCYKYNNEAYILNQKDEVIEILFLVRSVVSKDTHIWIFTDEPSDLVFTLAELEAKYQQVINLTQVKMVQGIPVEKSVPQQLDFVFPSEYGRVEYLYTSLPR